MFHRMQLMFLLSLVFNSPAWAGPAEEALQRNLAAYDEIFLSNYQIDIEAHHPTLHEPAMGHSTSTVILSGDGVRHALTKRVNKTEPIPFNENLKYHPYDSEGNLIVGLSESTSIYFDFHGGKIKNMPVVKILSGKPSVPEQVRRGNPHLEIHAGSNPDMLNLYYRHILPLGRGYSQLLSMIELAQEDSSGRITAFASGTLFSNRPGKWRLVIDPSNDFLVQEASFMQDGFSTEQFKCAGADPVGFELKLYSKGTIQFSDYKMSVQLKSYNVTVDDPFIAAVEADVHDMQALAPRATIMDFRQLDGNGVPAIQRLKSETSRPIP